MHNWSLDFLHKSTHLINSIKSQKYSIHVTNRTHQQIPYIAPDTLYRVYLQVLPQQSLCLQHLTNDQYRCLLEINRVISNVDDFNYMMSHLPYSNDVMEILSDYILSHQILPAVYQNYIVGHFVSPVIHQWIYTNCRQLYTYNVKSDSLECQINLISQSSLHQHQLDQCVANIISVIQTLRLLYHINQIQSQVILTYIITPFHKTLDYFQTNTQINTVMIRQLSQLPDLKYNYQVFNNPINNLSINSGVTVKGKYICIWRAEEFYKVLFHELIHYYDLERGNGIAPHDINISNNYPHHSKELWTELQTWYICILWCLSHQTTYDLKSTLDNEVNHSISNLNQIMYKYQMTILGNSTINVNSSVLYYVIYKALILSHHNKMIENYLLPSDNNDRSYNDHQLSSYLTYILTNYKVRYNRQSYRSRFTMMGIKPFQV